MTILDLNSEDEEPSLPASTCAPVGGRAVQASALAAVATGPENNPPGKPLEITLSSENTHPDFRLENFSTNVAEHVLRF